MNEQPEQQPQTPHPVATELPNVPPVTEQPVAVPVEPQLQPQPIVPTPETIPTVPVVPSEQTEPIIASEPLGRPQESQGGDVLTWQASEYVEHEKSAKWFIVLGVIVVILALLAVLLMKNYMFALLIVVMGVAVAVWARRPATEMQYELETGGVSVNGKHFALHDFRAFGLLQDGAIYAVVLLPNKRFSPGVNIYFPHELGEQIVDRLGATLPMETMEPDWIDKLTRKLNF